MHAGWAMICFRGVVALSVVAVWGAALHKINRIAGVQLKRVQARKTPGQPAWI